MTYVNDKALGDARNEYVLWVDIMGTKNKIQASVKTASIFMLKLHVAILENLTESLTAYPIMDGAYITSPIKSEMEKFITKLFASIGKDMNIQETQHVFLIKGSLAFGPVINGHDIDISVSRVFENETQYKDSILIGLPMVQAHESETFAPPFGVYIHESARAFCPPGETPFIHKWWKWYLKDRRIWKIDDSIKLYECIKKYFEKSEREHILQDYQIDRIHIHREMFSEFFSDQGNGCDSGHS